MKKIKIIALLSAFLMFAALFMILSNMTDNENEKEQNLSDKVHVIQVIKAKYNIAPYTTITEDMIEIKPMVAELDFKDYFDKKEDVIGSISLADVFQGEILSDKRVVKKEDARVGLAFGIEKGMRTVTLPVSTVSGVANTLKIGNFVDVIISVSNIQGVMKDNEENETKNETRRSIPAGLALDELLDPKSPANSQVFLNNVQPNFSFIAFQKLKILSLDDKFFASAGDAATGNSYGTVTLEVSPAQATQIVLLRNIASIDLILRNQDDDELINEPRAEILQKYQANPDQ